MKKFILSLGLVAMMLNLTNCAQYDDVNSTVEPQGDFEIYASATRTANAGDDTVWVTGDDLNVFHAVGETTTYVNDGQFTLKSTETGRFTGNLASALDPQKEYDWYAIYPYVEKRTTPDASDSKGYTGVGSWTKRTPEQDGYGNTDHLAGEDYPLAGVVKAVSAGTSPSIEMKNLVSVLEFNIINTIDAEVVVKSVSFTAPEDIIGTYFINFVNLDDVKFTPSGPQYVSATATVNVADGTALAKDASATVFMGIKPFTAAKDSKLTVKVTADVNGVESVYTKDITLAKETKFVSGAIKPVKVNFEAELPSAEDIVEVIDFTKQGYANGDAVSTYNGDFCSIAFDKGTNTNDPKYYSTGTAVRCYGGNTFTISSELLNIVKVVFTFDSGEGTNAISATPGSFATNTWVGDAKSVKFTIGGTTGHRRIQKMVITYYGELKPMIIPTSPAAVAYNATSATINYDLVATNGAVTATTDADWITAVDCNTDGKVVLTLTENTAYIARSADVTLSKEGAEDVTVKVTQNGKPKPTLTLTTPTVNVDADATTATIKYSYTNLIGDVTATTEADWIKNINCSTLGQVVVTFDANSTSEERTAKITISSTDATSVTATITQAEAGASAAEPIVVTYNFKNKSTYPSGFPTSGSGAASAKEFNFGGNPLIINAPTSYYMINPTNNSKRALFFGKTNTTFASTAYLEIPAKAGYTITNITIHSGANMAKSVSCNIYSTSGTAMSTAVAPGKDVDVSYNLTSPQANTPYRFASTASGKNIQLFSLTVTYTPNN